MRFALTDEQIALRDAVREVLAKACPATGGARRFARRSSRRGVEGAWWSLGLPGMAVPERDGGLGLSDVDLVPVLIEVGAAAVPLPVAETAAVAAPLLAAAGDPGGLLPGIVAGSSRIALRLGAGPVPYAGRCGPRARPGRPGRPDRAARRRRVVHSGWIAGGADRAAGRRRGRDHRSRPDRARPGPGRRGDRRPVARAEPADAGHDGRLRAVAAPVRRRRSAVSRRSSTGWPTRCATSSSPNRSCSRRPGRRPPAHPTAVATSPRR